MSYNFNPKWTSNIVPPKKDDMKCPHCGTVAFNVDDVMACLFEYEYYNPRYIPPELIFTCGNPDCEKCDYDFIYRLSAVITATVK